MEKISDADMLCRNVKREPQEIFFTGKAINFMLYLRGVKIYAALKKNNNNITNVSKAFLA